VNSQTRVDYSKYIVVLEPLFTSYIFGAGAESYVAFNIWQITLFF